MRFWPSFGPESRVAAQATTHCLTGCAIGEVLGFAIGTSLGWSNLATIALAIVLAYVVRIRAHHALAAPRRASRSGPALGVAFAADTVSITVMEIVDNLVVLAIPGAMDAGLGDWLFWGSLALALAIAWVAAFPVNKWLIGRGKGHAVVHAHHH